MGLGAGVSGITKGGGEPVRELLAEMAAIGAEVAAAGAGFGPAADNLASALAALHQATDWVLARLADDPAAAAAGCSPYLRLWGLTLAAHLLAKGALRAQTMLDAGAEADREFLAGRIATARFFIEQILPQAPALLPAATAGTELVYAISEERLAG